MRKDFEVLFHFIEDHLGEKISLEDVAKAVNISPVHLERVFKFAYGLPLMDYVRRRKLAESLNALLQEQRSVLEIAMEYGFEHEQSFARAFKKEFDITPGRYRKERPVLQITPPIQDFGMVCKEGLLFGPEVVMLPKVRMIGIEHQIPYNDSEWMAPKAALDFWDHEKDKIEGKMNDHIYYGLIHLLGRECDYSHYLTAVEVQKGAKPPQGMKVDAFGGGSCIRFHYVGHHHYRNLSSETAKAMYGRIEEYFMEKPELYSGIHLEKVDTTMDQEQYCMMEWFIPYGDHDKKSSVR